MTSQADRETELSEMLRSLDLSNEEYGEMLNRLREFQLLSTPDPCGIEDAVDVMRGKVDEVLELTRAATTHNVVVDELMRMDAEATLKHLQMSKSLLDGLRAIVERIEEHAKNAEEVALGQARIELQAVKRDVKAHASLDRIEKHWAELSRLAALREDPDELYMVVSMSDAEGKVRHRQVRALSVGTAFTMFESYVTDQLIIWMGTQSECSAYMDRLPPLDHIS